MKNPTNVEIILYDGSTALASDHIDTLIASEVANTIAEISHEYDLSKRADIQQLSELIADHLTISTSIVIDPEVVVKELCKQLKRH